MYNHLKLIARMWREGYHIMAQESKKEMDEREESYKKEISQIKEIAFQNYLAEHNKHENHVAVIQEFTKETLEEACKMMGEAIDRMNTITQNT